jgi:hypothetical protein
MSALPPGEEAVCLVDRITVRRRKAAGKASRIET